MDNELYKRSAINRINRLYDQGKTIVEINEDAGTYEVAPEDGFRQYATDGTVTMTIKFVPAKQNNIDPYDIAKQVVDKLRSAGSIT